MTLFPSRFVGLLSTVLLVAAPVMAQTPPQTPPATPQTPAPSTPNLPVGHSPDDGHNHAAPGRPTPPVVPPVNLPPAKPEVKLPSNVAARVGNRDITRDDVLRLVEMYRGREYVSTLIDVALLEQEAKRLGVVVTDAEVKKGVQAEKERVAQAAMMQGTPMSFSEIQKREGITDELLRRSVRLRLLQRKAMTKTLEKEVPSRDTQSKFAHILVATMNLPSSTGEEPKPLTPEEQQKKETDAKTKIDQMLADIKAGKRTWDDAVKESDDKGSVPTNGELDYYAPGQLDPEFAKAGFGIKNVGEIVGPIKSQFGYHIIKLVGRGKDLPAAEKTKYRKDQVERALTNQQFVNQWLTALRSEKNIIRNPNVQIVPGLKPATTPARPAVRKSASR